MKIAKERHAPCPDAGAGGPAVRPRKLAMLALLCTAAGTAAGAGKPPEPGFTFGPSETIEHDSNLTRTSGEAGASEVSDTLYNTSLGANFNRDYGRERVNLAVSLGRVVYQNTTSLDYTQQALDAGIVANLPLNIDAQAQAAHHVQMVHFADIGAPIRDVITSNSAAGSLAFPLISGLRAVVGGNAQHSSNSGATLRFQDTRAAEGNAGLRLESSSGNHVDVLVRSVHATHPNYIPGVASANQAISPGYDERGADISGDWTFSAGSRLHGRAGYLRHTGDEFDAAPGPGQILPVGVTQIHVNHNFAGPAFDVTYTWQATALSKIDFLGSRATGAVGDNNFLSAVTRTYRITPTYQAGAKTEISAYALWAQYAYASDPLIAAAAGLTGAQALRLDHERDAGIAVDWTPRRWLEIKADVHQEHRSSSISFYGFTANVVVLSAVGTF